MAKLKTNKAKPEIKAKGMHDLMCKVAINEEKGIKIYSFKLQDELTKVRTRMKEIYHITMPLRKELYNLSKRHNEILEEVTGVKVNE